MGYEEFHRWISRVCQHVAATRAMNMLLDLMPPLPKAQQLTKPANENKESKLIPARPPAA